MITITNEDNMDLMARYPDNYFDLAIVDPPYGIGFDKKIREKKSKNWDNAIPDDKYFMELKRVSKNQIIWGGNYFPYLWKNGCRGFIFWNKDVNFGAYSAGELAFTSFDKPANYFYYAWNGLADGIRGRNKKQKTIHPTQKPVKLYEWILMNYATCKTCKNEGGYYEDVAGDGGSRMYLHCEDCNGKTSNILDTHLGSGSIAIACHNLGFDLTACEMDRDYFEAALKRLKQHQAQTTLF